HLAEVDEPGLRAHGAGQEGRARPRRADDEDDALGLRRVTASLAKAALRDTRDRAAVQTSLANRIEPRHRPEDYETGSVTRSSDAGVQTAHAPADSCSGVTAAAIAPRTWAIQRSLTLLRAFLI